MQILILGRGELVKQQDRGLHSNFMKQRDAYEQGPLIVERISIQTAGRSSVYRNNNGKIKKPISPHRRIKTKKSRAIPIHSMACQNRTRRELAKRNIYSRHVKSHPAKSGLLSHETKPRGTAVRQDKLGERTLLKRNQPREGHFCLFLPSSLFFIKKTCSFKQSFPTSYCVNAKHLYPLPLPV